MLQSQVRYHCDAITTQVCCDCITTFYDDMNFRVAQKTVSQKGDTMLLSTTLPNADWFSKFLYRHTKQGMC